MTGVLYIHLDNTSNSVLTKGIGHRDFNQALEIRPQNILLLDPQQAEGEFEAHTGFFVIRGVNNVADYFERLERKKIQQLKWIDFNDFQLLKQLTAMEIAELLYFGHMRTQLHSPFFYKLQNNFVFFETPDDMTKIYYRHFDLFYRLLSGKITELVQGKLNERRGLFRKLVTIPPASEECLKQLKPLMQEGIVFDFRQVYENGEKYQVAVYIVEDRVRNLENKTFKKENCVAHLTYHVEEQRWTFEEFSWGATQYIKQA